MPSHLRKVKLKQLITQQIKAKFETKLVQQNVTFLSSQKIFNIFARQHLAKAFTLVATYTFNKVLC